jgi:hypothetical protein
LAGSCIPRRKDHLGYWNSSITFSCIFTIYFPVIAFLVFFVCVLLAYLVFASVIHLQTRSRVSIIISLNPLTERGGVFVDFLLPSVLIINLSCDTIHLHTML